MRTKFALILIALLVSLNVQALEIKPFNVRYHIYRGDLYIANSQFALNKQQGEWVWSMKSKARGIYSWLTRKKPYIETHMQELHNELQLLLESSGDYPDKPPSRSSWFDHANKIIYSMKGKDIKQLKLPEHVYNYHSIHLLYPEMLKNNITQMEVNFFKSGSLLKSTLTLEKQWPLPGKKSTTIVDKITQKFADQKKYFVYYYKGDTLAPLKIEQINPGKDKSVMWRVDDY